MKAEPGKAEPGNGPLLPVCGQACKFGTTQITPETLVALMEGKYANVVADYVIIDCRYDYEFEGGHICGALNLNRESLVRKLYERARAALSAGKTPQLRRALIFHCEFSQRRGPFLCHFFRSLDRRENRARYPYLDYPETHVLKGGYKAFYKLYARHCEPQGYVPMDDRRYVVIRKALTAHRQRHTKPSQEKTQRLGLAKREVTSDEEAKS